MRYSHAVSTFAFFSLFALVFAIEASAQDTSEGTVIDLRKYQHADGMIRTQPQTYIPGYTGNPTRTAPPAPTAVTDFVVVQPKSILRSVGNLREKMTVVRGESVLGRNEFEISCSIGAAYAHLPGEETPFRFLRQSDCKALLNSQSITAPCRSKLSIQRQTRVITVVGQACAEGPFKNTVDLSPAESDQDDLQSLAERARSARTRLRQSAR